MKSEIGQFINNNRTLVVAGAITLPIAIGTGYLFLKNYQAEPLVKEPGVCRYEGDLQIGFGTPEYYQSGGNEKALEMTFSYPRAIEPPGLRCFQVGVTVIEEAGLIVFDTTHAFSQRSVQQLFETNPLSDVFENKALWLKNLPGEALLEGSTSGDPFDIKINDSQNPQVEYNYKLILGGRQNVFRYFQEKNSDGETVRYILLGGEKVPFENFLEEVARLYQPFGETRILGYPVTLPKDMPFKSLLSTPTPQPTATSEIEVLAREQAIIDTVFDPTDLRPSKNSPTSRIELSLAIYGRDSVTEYSFQNQEDPQKLINALNKPGDNLSEVNDILREFNKEADITFYERFVLSRSESTIQKEIKQKTNLRYEIVSAGFTSDGYVLVVRDMSGSKDIKVITLSSRSMNKARFSAFSENGVQNKITTRNLRALSFWKGKELGGLKEFGVDGDQWYTKGVVVIPSELVQSYSELAINKSRQGEVLNWIKNRKPFTDAYVFSPDGTIKPFLIPSGTFITNSKFRDNIFFLEGKAYYRGYFSTSENNNRNVLDPDTANTLNQNLVNVFGVSLGVFEVLIPLESITPPFHAESLNPAVEDDRPERHNRGTIYISRRLGDDLEPMSGEVICTLPVRQAISPNDFVRKSARLIAETNSQLASVQKRRSIRI